MPQALLVQGPAGIGKSALLTAFSQELEAAEVLKASGDEAEAFLPYGVVNQLLGEHRKSWEDPFVAGAALLRRLDLRGIGQPSVLVVDDAHLADSASMTALTFALRRLHADRVLAVFSSRDDDLARLPAGLLRLVDAQTNRLRLGGLTDEEVAELAVAGGHERLPPRAATRLQRHTGGNPLYLDALMDELPAELVTSTSGPLPAPQSYALLVAGSLAALSAEARALAQAASVLPDGSRMELVGGVAGVQRPEQAFEELNRSSFLSCRPGEGGWTVQFSHPLARAVVYDELGPRSSADLHTRAAALVSGEAALLHRVAAASGPDPTLAAELGRHAEQCRQAGDVHKAAELMLRAAQLTGEGPDANDRLMEAANLLVIDGDITAAKALAASLDAAPPSARRFYLQAKIAWLQGQPGLAEQLATQAWARGDELEPERRGSLAAILAQLYNMRGDGTRAADWASRALELGLPPDLVDSTAAARAFGLSLAGRIPEALGQLESIPSGSTARGQQHYGHRLTTRGVLRVAVDDLDGARADLSAVCSMRYGGLPPHRLVAMGALAEVDYRLGAWDSSLALAEQAVSLAEDSEQVWVQGYLHTTAILAAAGRGAWERAEHHLAEARRLATQLEDPATFAVCENAGVHIASCRAEPDEVVARAQLLLGLKGGPTHEPGLLGWPVEYLSALVELGHLDQADSEIEGFDALARERGSRSRLAALARVRGELATARRSHQAARAAFEEALEVGDDKAQALDAALALASYGRFLRRRGEKRAAVARLEEARAAMASLGASPFAQRCDDELAACGVAPGRSSLSAGVALTPQEQIVAGLVCQGLSNQEVAHQLVLSVKTVGYHLGNAYAKLGVHSRTQLVAAWGGRDETGLSRSTAMTPQEP